jgi:hypothetical protein
MKAKRLLCVLFASLVLAACTAWQQGLTPGVIGASPTPDPLDASQTVATAGHPAAHLIVRGARPKNCPSKFVYCVTVSESQKAQLYFCYSPGSYCGGPSQYQYSWSGSFTDREGHHVKYFEDYFLPNPGDPSYDTIMEQYRVKPTYGAYKYVQWVCAWQNEICQSKVYVGIAVQ